MCGATIPEALLRELELRADEPEAVAEIGVAYATLQCADLLANGAPGIHFYTLNRSPGDARDPQRAAADGAVARRRAGLSANVRRSVAGLDLERVGHARRPSTSQATSTWSLRR